MTHHNSHSDEVRITITCGGIKGTIVGTSLSGRILDAILNVPLILPSYQPRPWTLVRTERPDTADALARDLERLGTDFDLCVRPEANRGETAR